MKVASQSLLNEILCFVNCIFEKVHNFPSVKIVNLKTATFIILTWQEQNSTIVVLQTVVFKKLI